MLGEYSESVKCYTKAINTPLLEVALLKRAIANTELKQYGPAIEDLKKVIELDPKHSEAYYFKGLILSKQGKKKKKRISIVIKL